VVRQAKARQNKIESPSKSSNYASKNSSLLPVEAVRESDSNRSNMERRASTSPPTSPVATTIASLENLRMVRIVSTFASTAVRMSTLDWNGVVPWRVNTIGVVVVYVAVIMCGISVYYINSVY
jgi:hypothetical protein